MCSELVSCHRARAHALEPRAPSFARPVGIFSTHPPATARRSHAHSSGRTHQIMRRGPPRGHSRLLRALSSRAHGPSPCPGSPTPAGRLCGRGRARARARLGSTGAGGEARDSTPTHTHGHMALPARALAPLPPAPTSQSLSPPRPPRPASPHPPRPTRRPPAGLALARSAARYACRAHVHRCGAVRS